MKMEHVAYLIPHTDLTGEMDCARFLPGCVMHVERMWLGEVSEEAERKMLEEEFPRALRYLKGLCGYKCAVFGCTSASAAEGMEGMIRLEREMEQALGCPSVTALGAVLKEIREYGAGNVAILTPYTEEVNRFFRDTVEKFGVSVCFAAGMGISDDRKIAELLPEEILEFAERTAARIPEEADLCFFSCTNLRAAEIRGELEAALHRPVITSNQCIIDYIRKL